MREKTTPGLAGIFILQSSTTTIYYVRPFYFIGGGGEGEEDIRTLSSSLDGWMDGRLSELIN